MSKQANSIRKTVNAIIVLAAIIAVIVFALRDPARFGRIAFVIIGFGAMIFIHELGHFLVAKNADIECHTFSLGFPPVLLGFRQTEKGWRFRILPTIFARSVDDEQESQEADGQEAGIGNEKPKESEQTAANSEDAEKETAILTFTIPRKCKASDTEYCIGLIPFGGYVGMLGQEDSDVPEATANPRSFGNKSIPVRMAVISAGVIFNLIGAFAIFATIAGIGIDLPPAVIGEVTADMPADKAGLVAGDEILEIAGKTKIDFTNLVLASALSKKGAKIPMTVRHRDGTIEDFEVGTAMIPGMKLRGFGIGQAQSLKIMTFEDDDELYAAIGLRSGDEVFAVDGRDVSAVWELEEAIEKIRRPTVMLSVRRNEEDTGRTGLINTTLDLDMAATSNYDISDESQLYHIYSMVPRLRVTAVRANPVSDKSRVRILFEDKLRLRGLMEKLGLAGPAVKKKAVAGGIKAGDIIVKIGEVDFPTYLDLSEVTSKHDKKEMAVTVLRRDSEGVLQRHDLTVIPRTPPGGDRPLIGIGVTLDTQTPVVANTISTAAGPLPLSIPRGALITAVDGEAVSDFYDIIEIISKNAGQRISLEYRVDATVAGSVSLSIAADNPHIAVKSELSVMVPFENLRRNYKAGNVAEIFSMGLRHMTSNVMQTYATLKALLSRQLGADALMGPIGIVSISYKIVEARQFVFYLKFLGMISAMLAVLNFLPFPIVDGGVFLLLMIEKIKGSPVSMRVQQAIVYVGVALLLTLFVYVTFRDILNLVVPQ